MVGRKLLPDRQPRRIAAGAEGDIEVGILPGQVQESADVGVGLASAGVEDRVQPLGLAVLQRLPDQTLGNMAQLHVATRGEDRKATVLLDVVAVIELLAAHVFVAGGDIALGHAELLGPAGNGVLIVADQRLAATDQFPGMSATAEAIDLVPRKVAPPTANQVTRGTAPTTGQDGKARILHLLEVENPFEPDHRGEDAAQQSALQRAVLVVETVPGDIEPA